MRTTDFKPIVSQEQHDYFKREMGRPMDEFEQGVLEDMLLKLGDMNKKLVKLGKASLVHKEGDLVQVFIDRVRHHEAEAATRKIMTGYTGGRRDARHA
jgi:hypothetical protein